MARLDDAGVDGPDRDLVHAVALDAHEGVVGERVGGKRSRIEVAAQREGCSGQAPWRSHGRVSAAPEAPMPSRSKSARCMRPATGKSPERSG